jgi:hypothetical protein
MGKELNFNDGVVEFLKEEERLLRGKANKMLDNHDFVMYTKIINSYQNVVELIKKYDYQLMYSEYKLDDENGQNQVAVWEQNGEGIIRKHKVWNVGEVCMHSQPIPKLYK